MKKKAARTDSVACRVLLHEKEAIEKAAAGMEMSKSQYIKFILSITQSGTDLQQLQDRLIEVTAQLEDLQQQVESEK